MYRHKLFDNGSLQWFVFGRDPKKPDEIIDTNEYLLISDGEAMLMDPGGAEIFPSVLTEISSVVELNQIKAYLCSHQDPDIMSSLPLWMDLTPNAKIYISWLWTGFISHFGHEHTKKFVNVEDEGMNVALGSASVKLVPAHHCHSAGNFHLFEPESGILFTGDVGAALLPAGAGMFVEDFDHHIQFMEGFHKRWMPSNEAKNIWVSRVRKLGVKMLCPQHGSIFKGDDVGRFLDWFEDLEVGRLKKFA